MGFGRARLLRGPRVGGTTVAQPFINLTGTRAIIEGSAAGTNIGTFQVLVVDDTGLAVAAPGTWVFTLLVNTGNHFAIDGAQLEAGPVATDFEAQTLTGIMVMARNTDSNRILFANVNITVLDEDTTITDIVETWLAGYEDGNVPDNTSIGEPLATFTVTGGTGTISLALAADPDQKFALEQIDDVWTISLAGDVSAATHAFRLRATDDEGAYAEDFSITRVVINNAPTDITVDWAAGFENGVIPEDTALGTKIADSITVTDDVGDTHTVTIDDPTGVVQLISGEIFLTATLHAATSPTHTFTVRAVDQDDLEFSKIIPINVATVAADAAATTLIARATVAPSAAREGNIRRVYARLKRAGWIGACDFLFVPMAHTQQFANENWKAELGELSPQNSVTWTEDLGYESPDTTTQKHVALGINPLTLGTLQMLQDDIFCFVMSMEDSGGSSYHLGSANSRLRIRVNDSGSNGGSIGTAGQNNTLSSQSNPGGQAPAVGMITQKAGVQQLWRNGSLTPVDVDTVEPAGLPSDLYLFRNGSTPVYERGQAAVAGGGKCPATFLAERFAALYRALIEYSESLETEIDSLPDIDLLTTTTGVVYTRAGQKPYVDSNGDYALAAANVWPLDHDPTSPHAPLGRRLDAADVLINYGSKRVFTGWTATLCTFGASAAYTSWFGDTLGGRLVENASLSGAKTAVGPSIVFPSTAPNGFFTSDVHRVVVAVIVKPGATWTNRRLRLQLKRAGGGSLIGIYNDFDLAAGTRVGAGELGSGTFYDYNPGTSVGDTIIPMKNGFFRILLTGSLNTFSPFQVVLQLLDGAGSPNLPTGTANVVEIDGIDVCAATSQPPIFGALASVSAASVGMSGITVPVDIGMTGKALHYSVDRTADVEYYRRNDPNTSSYGVIPVADVAAVSWPLDVVQKIPGGSAETGRWRSYYQRPQHIKRLRAAPAGDFEPFVFPAAYAARGETVETRIIPSSSPFEVTLSGTPGDPQTVSVPGLTRVVGTPAAGQFSVSGAVVTFNTVEAGTSRAITWWPAIQTCLEADITGGGTAAWVDITTETGASALGARWGSNGSTPRRYRLGNGLPELLRSQGNVQLDGNNITLRGNGDVLANRGGGLWIGNSSGAPGTPYNVIIEDFVLAAGEFPVAGGAASATAPYSAAVPMVLTNVSGTFIVGAKIKAPNGANGIIKSVVGSTLEIYANRLSSLSNPVFAAGQVVTQINGGLVSPVATAGGTIVSWSPPSPAVTSAFNWDGSPVQGANADDGKGYSYGDRDSLRCWSGTRLKIRNCTIMWSIDEACSIYINSNASSDLKDVVIEHCIIAEALADPKDPTGRYLHGEWQNHSGGLLFSGGSVLALSGAGVFRNIVGRYNVLVGNSRRNPLAAASTGLHWYNNIADKYGAFAMSFGTYKGRLPSLTSVEGNIIGKGSPVNAIQLTTDNDTTGGLPGYAHQACYYFKDNFKRPGDIMSSAGEAEMNWDWISQAVQNEFTTSRLVRDRPFYTDRVPFPMTTVAERNARIQWIIDRAGGRYRDGSDNIITGDAGAYYQTKRILDRLRDPNDAIGYIDYPSEVGGYRMTAP